VTHTCCLVSTNTPVTPPMIQWLGMSSGHDGSTLKAGAAEYMQHDTFVVPRGRLPHDCRFRLAAAIGDPSRTSAILLFANVMTVIWSFSCCIICAPLLVGS
jgi:hypothetical protein